MNMRWFLPSIAIVAAVTLSAIAAVAASDTENAVMAHYVSGALVLLAGFLGRRAINGHTIVQAVKAGGDGPAIAKHLR